MKAPSPNRKSNRAILGKRKDGSAGTEEKQRKKLKKGRAESARRVISIKKRKRRPATQYGIRHGTRKAGQKGHLIATKNRIRVPSETPF